MRISVSYRKAGLFLVLIIAFVSCNKSGCIDKQKSDRYYAEVKQWKFDDSLGNRTLVDSYGVSQTLMFMGSDSVEYDESVWDDCGQSYGSFSASVQFNTSMSPLNFYINLNAGCYIEEEYEKWPSYYINIIVTDTRNPAEHHKNITYDFITRKVFDGAGKVRYLDNFTIGGQTYLDVLEFDFDWMFSDNDIKKLYYTKRYGIISFVDGYGNGFNVVTNR